MERKCKECNAALYGRIDKKYCSDYCRNAFNNKVNRDHINLIRNVNNRLRRNFRILNSLRNSGTDHISRLQLIDANFDFTHVTSVSKTENGEICYYIYDVGFKQIGPDEFLLIDCSPNSLKNR